MSRIMSIGNRNYYSTIHGLQLINPGVPIQQKPRESVYQEPEPVEKSGGNIVAPVGQVRPVVAVATLENMTNRNIQAHERARVASLEQDHDKTQDDILSELGRISLRVRKPSRKSMK